MTRRYEDLRVRLIQVRERPAVIEEEYRTFLERCRLRPDQLVTTNALSDPLSPDLLRDVDAVMIGGAGAYSVTQTYPWTAPMIGLVKECYERSVPLFGSCWGHQFIARTFGGTVVHDPARSEMGTHEVTLTEAGLTDPLFGHFPPRFKAQMGHQDRVSVLPPEAVELATNGTAPHQAFRLADRPIYGTQFHSELDAARERERLLTYRSYYPELLADTAFSQTLDSVRETPEVDTLLYTFLTQIAVSRS